MPQPDTATPNSPPLGDRWSAQDDTRRGAVSTRFPDTTSIEDHLTTPPSSPQGDGDARTATPAADVEERQHRIRLHAYHRYLARGGSPGAELDDWLEAEREEDARRP